MKSSDAFLLLMYFTEMALLLLVCVCACVCVCVCVCGGGGGGGPSEVHISIPYGKLIQGVCVFGV